MYNPKHNNIRRRKRKGGVIIETDKYKAFEHFITNSQISYLSAGSFGIVFIATLNNDVESNYKFLDARYFNIPVTKLVIKLGFSHDSKRNETKGEVDINPKILKINWEYDTIDVERFQNEVNIQTEIYLKTMNYLQPVCPAIVYANNFNNYNENNNIMSSENLIDLLINNSSSQKDKRTKFANIILKHIKNLNDMGIFTNLSMIAMEYANGYNSLHTINSNNATSDETKLLYSNMCLFLLIRLAIETGYSQADFHSANFLIDSENDTYFNNYKGAPLLLDFGLASKIPPELLSEIKQLYKEKKYTDILQKICSVPRLDNKDVRKYPKQYGWVCGNYDTSSNERVNEVTGLYEPLLNEELTKLFEERDVAIKEVIEAFDEDHKEKSEIYPLLPLSNAIKNKLYDGMIDVPKNNEINGNVTPQNAGKKTRKIRRQIIKKNKKKTKRKYRIKI